MEVVLPSLLKPKHKNALDFVHNLKAQNFPNCKEIWACCKKKKHLPAAKDKWNNIKWKIYIREDRIAVSNLGTEYLMSKKNWFIRIYIRACISRQHTLRIVSLYYFVFSLMVSGFGAFYMMKWNKNVSQCWYKTQIYGNFCCSLEMMRYPSDTFWEYTL